MNGSPRKTKAGMNGLKEYTRAMLDLTSARIEMLLAANRKELEKVYANHLFKLPGAHRLNPHLSRDENLFSKLFHGFSEIFASNEALKDLASLPITGTKLPPVQYIRMNIECYLTEVYILQQRLLSYVSVIEKVTRSGTAPEVYKHVRRIAPHLKKSVYKAFERICGVRGSHIHETRYDDQDLSRVSSLELLVNSGHMKELQLFYRRECKELRKKWAKPFPKTMPILRFSWIYTSRSYSRSFLVWKAAFWVPCLRILLPQRIPFRSSTDGWLVERRDSTSATDIIGLARSCPPLT